MLRRLIVGHRPRGSYRPMYCQPSLITSPNMDSAPLRIMTLNVRGLGSARKQAQLVAFLQRDKLDVVAIQEMKLSTDEATGSALQGFVCDYDIIVSHASLASSGCFLFIRKSQDSRCVSFVSDANGRFIVADIVLRNVTFRVIVLYAPNSVARRVVFF